MKAEHQPVKINISSLQVLKTLMLLMQDNYSMAELVEKMNEKEPESIFNNSVISKYINTCRFCGIKIPKINNKYYVTSIPFGLEITDEDSKLIEIMIDTVQNKMSARANRAFSKFLETLNKYSNKEIIRSDENTKNLILETFEKACTDGKKVRLILNTGIEKDVIPIEVVDFKEKQYFNVCLNGKEELIITSKIKGIQVLNETYRSIRTNKITTFTLSGGLASRYQLRENETVETDNTPAFLSVINQGENEEILLSRLLRYDSLCKIETPKYLHDKMKQIIDATLANYGE